MFVPAVQKEAMTGALEGGGTKKDAMLYISLAAAAFLLVLLYPDAEAPPAEQPPAAAAAGAHIGGASLGAAKRAADLVQLQQQLATSGSGDRHEAGDGRAPGTANCVLPTNRESSASLNVWLGVDRHSEPRPAPADTVNV